MKPVILERCHAKFQSPSVHVILKLTLVFNFDTNNSSFLSFYLPTDRLTSCLPDNQTVRPLQPLVEMHQL